MKFAKVLFICLVFIGFTFAQSPIFEENFDYPVDSLLTDFGWTNHSGTGYPIHVVEPGLIYTDYPPSGIGNAVELVSTTSSAEDVNKNFPEQSADSVYAAFMVNVSSAETNGTYFFHLGPTNMGTSIFLGKVFIENDGSDNIAFGVSKTSTSSVSYSSYSYSLNTTHLIIFKYVFNTGSSTDDEVELWINPDISDSEPPSDLTQTDSGDDAINLAKVALRQGYQGPGLTIDGIRIGTSWDGVVSGGVTIPPVISNLILELFPADQAIDITCDVTVSEGSIDSVLLYYYTDFEVASTDSMIMSPTTGDEYQAQIPAQTNGTSLDYWVKAWGNNTSTVSAERKVIVGIPNIGIFHSQLDGDGLPLHLDYLTRLTGITTVSTHVFSTSNYDFYMQDNTGGINVFKFNYTVDSTQYSEGDSLVVVGTIDAYNGKVEITDFRIEEVYSGRPVPDPITIAIEDMGETYEGRLIQIENVSLAATSDPWPSTLGSITLEIDDGTGVLEMRIIDSTYIGENPEPNWPVTVVGIGSQYDYSAPHTEYYQLQPRRYEDFIPPVGIEDGEPVVYRYSLRQNYPNPFNPATTIKFELAKPGKVELIIYNILGQVVNVLTFDQLSAGENQVVWHGIDQQGESVSSGIYIYELRAENFRAVKKMLLVR